MRRALGVLLAIGVAAGACGSESAVVGRDIAETLENPADPRFGGTDAGEPDTSPRAPGDAGPPACAPYQSLCDGRCIPTSVDPRNCGACAKTCAPDEVCAGGTCGAGCLPGLFECSGQCVDLKTDSRHCNSCDFACPPGTGCVDGTCHPKVAVDPTGAACANGGPPTVLEVPGAAADKCAGQLAQTTFRWALCSCANVELANPLVTDAYDSTKGAYVPPQLGQFGGPGGGVGMNGTFKNDSTSRISGTLWSSSSAGGVLTSNQTHVGQELHVSGPLTVNSPFFTEGDAYVGGDISASASVRFSASLHHPEGAAIVGDVTYEALVPGPVTVAEACSCGTSEILPVEGIVAARRGPNNDNAKIGLDPNALVEPNAARRLDLPCGHYYLSAIATNAPVVIAAAGRTALYIDGDVVTGAPLAFVVDPAGELDIFVRGKLETSAKMTVGSSNHPALTRLYIGAVGTSFRITNDVAIGGFVYSARGKIDATNPVEVFGGVFAGDFRNSGSTTIHYDRAVLSMAGTCTAGLAPAPPTPAPGTCGSCEDCGNQACIGGDCGACTSNAECCAPLVCVNGACVINVK